MAMSPNPPSRSAGWRAWRFEVYALIGSALAFVAMVVLLAVFDGRPIFDWKSVTLNAIISVLSVMMKASLTFAVAELIGQWKWILFAHDARPLMDFERIDLASRGPLGGFQLLARMHGWRLWPLQLGSLVIVLAIALDPFSQQILQLQEGTKYTAARVTAPRAEMFYEGELITMADGKIGTQLSLTMRAAVMNGLAHDQEMIKQQGPMKCPTGICSWDQFQSLGVCSRCNDLTADLKRIDNFGSVFDAVYGNGGNVYQKEDVTAFVLPNGHFLMNINECAVGADLRTSCQYLSPIGHAPASSILMSTHGTGHPNKTITMQDVDTLIWSMSMIHIDSEIIGNPYLDKHGDEYKWPDMPVRSSECALYWCVQTLDAKIDGNIIQTNITEDTDAETRNTLNSLVFNPAPNSNSNGELILHFPNNASKPEYSIRECAVWSVNHYITDNFSTNLTGGANVSTAMADVLPEDAVGYNGLVEAGDGGSPDSLFSVWNPEKRNVTETFGTLAMSMSNAIRATDGEVDYVSGRKGTPTKYYRIQWGWIVLHGAMLMGSALFWFMTVRTSARQFGGVPAWKNSSLATITGASTAAEVLKGVDAVAEMEKKAREHQVKMPVDEPLCSPYSLQQAASRPGTPTEHIGPEPP